MNINTLGKWFGLIFLVSCCILIMSYVVKKKISSPGPNPNTSLPENIVGMAPIPTPPDKKPAENSIVLPSHVDVGTFMAPVPPPNEIGATRGGWGKLVDLQEFVPDGSLDRYDVTIFIPTGTHIWVCPNCIWQQAYRCPRNNAENERNTRLNNTISDFRFKADPSQNSDPAEGVPVTVSLDLKR